MRFVVSAAAVLVVLALMAPAVMADPPFLDCGPAQSVCRAWPVAGQNIADTHSQPAEHKINTGNVAGLQTRWTFTALPSVTSSASSDISATPTVAKNVVYFPDWGGHLYAVNAQTGKTIWARKISEYDGVAGAYSRTSPAIVGDLLILGDKPPSGINGWPSGQGAHIFAVNARTGNLVWNTKVDDTFVSQITGSVVTFRGVAYAGISSIEEVTATKPGYVCCIFRGSVAALDVGTGQILWKTFDMPPGYSGGAIWGSTAAVDPGLGLLYVGTGNNYSVPAGVTTVSPDDHFDSLLALDLKTGKIRWATGTIQFDNWTVACFGQTTPQPNCPNPSSPDADFGSGPNLFTAGRTTLVGAGTKGGTYWALDAATGKIAWATQVGPGGIFGGIEWGSSVADGHVYVAEANSAQADFPLDHPSPGTTLTSSKGAGVWEALDAATGKILWQTPDPAGKTFGAIGQVASANGVVYAGSTDRQGHVYALDGNTGQIKWSFATGGSIASGASIVNGVVYWGSGYSQFAAFGTTGNNKVFAFSLPGEGDDD